MTRFLALFTLGLTLSVVAQPLVPGDVLVTTHRTTFDEEGFEGFVSNIQVYDREGVFKRELITSTSRQFSEPFFRDGIVYVGDRWDGIARIDAGGNLLSPFTTSVVNVNFLSPGPEGGLLAANGSGEVYQFDAAGTRVRYRDIFQEPRANGIDLGADQCTVFWLNHGSLARWDACVNSTAGMFGPQYNIASTALRILPDGTFLAAFLTRVVHLDQDGNLIREYPFPAWGLALHPDRTSFWTDANGSLLRVNIATGAILSQTYAGAPVYGIAVVGEPRAGMQAVATDIPALSTAALVLLAMAVAIAGVIALRS